MTEHLDRGLATEELQEELRELLGLAVVGDHVRWALVGDGAGELADLLADAVPQWRALADQVAGHLVALGIAPDGRVRSLARAIPVNWVPDGWLRPDEARRLVAYRLRTVAEWARYRRSQATDSDTVQLLDAVASSLEAEARAVELTSTSRATPSVSRWGRHHQPMGRCADGRTDLERGVLDGPRQNGATECKLSST